MQSGEPSETSGQENPPAGQDSGGELTEAILSEPTTAPEPLFKGDAHVLWTTAGAFLAIFFIVIVIIMRMNARAAVRSRSHRPPSDFFQPAGEDAEITFDDEESVSAPLEQQAPLEPAATEPEEIEEEEAPAPQRQKKKLGGLFGGARKTVRKEEGSLSEDASDSDRQSRESVEPLRTHPLAEERRAKFESERQSAAPVLQAQIEDEARSAPRLAEDEAARARRQVEEEFRRIEEERRAAAERNAEFERRKQIAALEQQRQTIEPRSETAAEQADALARQIDELRRDLADELDARFAAQDSQFSERLAGAAASAESERLQTEEISTAFYDLEKRVSALSRRLDEQSGDAANDEQISAIASLVARRISEQRDSMDAALAALSGRVDALAERALEAETARHRSAAIGQSSSQMPRAPSSAPIIQLTEIIRSALPSDAYEMRSTLSNKRRADCLVRMPSPPGPVAIDAQFPVEAYHRLRSGAEAGDPAADSEFRRAVLRHIADIAERLIVPGETADSALMFVPSESIYSEIHARFPDLVQDSYRAHVWLVSPTTMMATLHTMYAALAEFPDARSAPEFSADSKAIIADLAALRTRVASLEDHLAAGAVQEAEASADALSETAPTPASAEEPAPAAAPQETKSETRKGGGEGDLWNDDQNPEQSNTPFPLR